MAGKKKRGWRTHLVHIDDAAMHPLLAAASHHTALPAVTSVFLVRGERD